jgi:hypothetical protein
MFGWVEGENWEHVQKNFRQPNEVLATDRGEFNEGILETKRGKYVVHNREFTSLLWLVAPASRDNTPEVVR